MAQGTRLSDLIAWISQDPKQEKQRVLSWQIDNNPTATYQLIQKLFPGKFRLMTSGAERSEAVRGEMYNFLMRQDEATVRLIVATPTYDFSVNNWTVLLDDTDGVIRDFSGFNSVK